MFLSFNYLTCSILLLFSTFLPLTSNSFSNMNYLIYRWRMRIARRRLVKALDRCTIEDLKRAAALNRWFQSTQFVPGDQITITFDGEHSDVILTGLSNRHFREEDQELLNALKNET